MTGLLIRRCHSIAFALIPALLASQLAGCVTAPKQTWQDWMTPGQVRHVSAAPIPPARAADAQPVSLLSPYNVGDGAKAGPGFDLLMRNPDFPSTYIKTIHIDVTSPNHWVQLEWTGPQAATAPVGPWRSCIGRGNPGMDCDSIKDSNTIDSRCTPKGVFPVAGFSDHLTLVPECHYATWVIHSPRFIAMHSFDDVASVPQSSGCIRLDFDTAKLIHNNSKAGVTLVSITGTWRAPAELKH